MISNYGSLYYVLREEYENYYEWAEEGRIASVCVHEIQRFNILLELFLNKLIGVNKQKTR